MQSWRSKYVEKVHLIVDCIAHFQDELQTYHVSLQS